MARLRSAPTSQQTAPVASTQRPALREKTNTTRAKVPVYENDGNTERLIKDARPRRGRAKVVAQVEDEFVMAGGLGQATSEDKMPERSEPPPPTTDDLAKSDGPPPPTAKANRRPPPRMARKKVQSEADSNILEGAKRRMLATARTEAAVPRKQPSVTDGSQAGTSSDSLPSKPPPPRKSIKSVLERSEYSISPSPPPPGKLHSVGKQRSSTGQPGSALRSHGTPAVESSILALKNFKRRARQPSMLQMVQQRTASARPSNINSRAAEDVSIYDLDPVEDDADDFEPEAEGTPLHIAKKARQSGASSKKTTARHSDAVSVTTGKAKCKRKSDEAGLSISASDALQTKRRKVSSAGDDGGSSTGLRKSPSVQQTSPARTPSSTPKIAADVEILNSPVSSTPPTEQSSPVQQRLQREDDIVVPSTEQEQDDAQHVLHDDLHDPDSDTEPKDTMAEPASSSPPAPEQLVATQRTDIMAEPLTQLSPPRPKRDQPKKKRKPAPVTTASLQSLLPRRRRPLKPRHRKSEYDIDSASEDDNALDTSLLEDDEDELGGNLRRQTKTKSQPKQKKKGKTSAAQSKSRPSKSVVPPGRKPSMTPPSRKSTTTKKAAKTYGRSSAAASDKENDGELESEDEHDDSVLPETSVSTYEAVRSKELEAAKRKFAQVDEWDMDFESMSVEEHRSSSQGWR